ncbi:aminoacylase-1-like isoform X2 [Spodoptera litura]|uniref:N-acyl-aliphatic-L-amino acid amidohydrolase n=1 Tax=Spodoptera litura TaxID=69820 RepID=A0A9J7DQB4_SPOLT|nr:aminoacylase-1-like isoform X2 [Spodoptera litura]
MTSIKMLISFIILGILSTTHISNAGPLRNRYSKYLELDAVQRLIEYIRIDTSREENIKHAVDFWVSQANDAGLPYTVYAPAGKPIFVATLEGSDPSLPSIMLNSHMDVVTVDETEWMYPPFAGYMDANGDIFGRGTQDTKDIGVVYMEVLRKFKKDNITLERTIHVTVMPDEETGGKNGMQAFVKTKQFKALNIGFALDEGLTSSDDTLIATYIDRRPWQMEFTVHGEGGHGSSIAEETAAEKLHKLMDTIMAYRENQKDIMRTKNANDYTGFNSININMFHGGQAPNIIPSKMSLVVDMRLAPEAEASEMQALVDSWVQEAGNGTELSYIRHEQVSLPTALDNSNPYWVTFKNTLNNMGITVRSMVCPATSDIMVLRNLGIPALGFTTKSNTISRIHAKDEYINVETFLRGIEIYTELVKKLGNLKTC